MTYTADIYDKKGKVVETVQLSDEVFGKEGVSPSLIHEYYLLQTANVRNTIAHTKTRGEVSGSGKKLYRQKGTGSGRAGEKRSPLRKKGGIVFGPRSERDFSKNMNKKARRLALHGLLSLKAKDGDIYGFQDLKLATPKTKDAYDFLKNISMQDQKVLVVLQKGDESLVKSFRNIDRVKYVYLDYLNPYDLMHYNKILFVKEALDALNETK